MFTISKMGGFLRHRMVEVMLIMGFERAMQVRPKRAEAFWPVSPIGIG